MGSSAPTRDIGRYVALWRAKRLPLEALRSDTRPLSDINVAMEALAAGDALRTILIPAS